jgi:carbon monoxide dehydrogenase subunit G
VKISNEFTVHTPIDRAWAVLTDLEGIAPCLPGAQLTGVNGDVYSGKVKVKVGPVISEFAGTAKFVEKDDADYRGVIDAKGKDARSAGNAAALITAQLRPDGDSTVVTVDTDLKISGKLAQFGSGMIKEVSGKLLGQFVQSLEAKIAADSAPAAAAPVPAAAPPTPAAAAPAPAAEPVAKAESKPAAVVDADQVNTAPALATRGSESVAYAPDRAAAPPATVEVAGPAAAVDGGVRVPEKGSAEPAPLDLMELAGGSIRKRLVPVAIGVAVIVAVWVVYRVVK